MVRASVAVSAASGARFSANAGTTGESETWVTSRNQDRRLVKLRKQFLSDLGQRWRTQLTGFDEGPSHDYLAIGFDTPHCRDVMISRCLQFPPALPAASLIATRTLSRFGPRRNFVFLHPRQHFDGSRLKVPG